MKSIKHIFTALYLFIILASCSSVKQGFIRKELSFSKTIYQHHIGFALYDLASKKFLFQQDADKYFTPASNTKILTLYASLLTLKDSIVGLEYVKRGDSLIFWGVGDPSFLNSETHHSNNVYHFLKNAQEQLYFSGTNYAEEHFGVGWAWDDYPYGFSRERSPMPIYGNALTIENIIDNNELLVIPDYFSKNIRQVDSVKGKAVVMRKLENNNMNYFPSITLFKKSIPFRQNEELLIELLTDTLNRNVQVIDMPKPRKTDEVYSIPTDSLYAKLMQDSDNFVAEQLLLACSNTIADTLKTSLAINHMLEKYLFDLPDQPIWKDGSGLSRYNLVTPRSVVALWEKIYNEAGQERLFKLLAVGGKSGTLKNHYKNDEPYVYGKTGTLSNNHSLSGFLITKKGRVFIFAYMNNNTPVSSSEIKPAMERLLKEVYTKY